MKNEAHLDLIAAKRTNSEHLGLTLVHKSKNLIINLVLKVVSSNLTKCTSFFLVILFSFNPYKYK